MQFFVVPTTIPASSLVFTRSPSTRWFACALVIGKPLPSCAEPAPPQPRASTRHRSRPTAEFGSIGESTVKDEMMAVYHQRVFAVGPFFGGPQMPQKAQHVHPTEIVGSRMMHNGV